MLINFFTYVMQGIPKIAPRLRGCCGGTIASMVSVFKQFQRLELNLEFETLV